MGKAIISGGAVMTDPVKGTPLSEVAVGSSVYLNENGNLAEYLVVHNGLPSSLYDSSCDGVWLLRKDCYSEQRWHSSDVNDYENSTIHAYLNGTFFSVLGDCEKQAVKSVKIPYCVGSSNVDGTLVSGANGLETKIFLLSGQEVGATNDGVGELLDYFDFVGSAGSAKLIAYYNGEAERWWLRDPLRPSSHGSTYANVIDTDGSSYDFGFGQCTRTNGVRPALILSPDAKLTVDGTIKI